MNTKKVLCILVFLVITSYEALSNESNSIPISDFKPSWQIGQRWLVKISKLTEPRSTPEDRKYFVPKPINSYYELLVEGMERVEDENCFKIRIDGINAKGEKEGIDSWDYPFCRFYVRESSFTIKKVQRLRKIRGEIILEWECGFPMGPVDATDALWGFLPMAFPYFEPNALDYKPQERIRKDKLKSGEEITIIERPPMDLITQKVNKLEATIDGQKQEAIEITLKDKNDFQKRVTKQIWVKGLPWWTNATVIKDSNEWCTARLIKVDEKDIVFQKPEDIKN
jgi:hypothetical protein